jgi:hypothetical protein
VRSLLAGVLLLAGALLVPVATAGWWARETIVPAQAYVDAVAPLAKDPAITKAIETQVVDRTMAAVRNRAPQLPASLRSRVKPLVRVAVHRAVATPAFAQAWRQANRTAHRQLVAVLTGRSTAVKSGPGSTVEIRLSPLTGALQQALGRAGVPFASQLRLPGTGAAIPIGSAQNLHRAQGAYQFLVRWGRWLPVLALVLIVLGLLVARRRASALAWTAVVALLGLGALALALFLGRGQYLDALPAGSPSSAGKAFFDIVTSGLRHDIELVAIGSAVVLVVSAAVAVVRR